MHPVFAVLAERFYRRPDGRHDIIGIHKSGKASAFPAETKIAFVIEWRVTEGDRDQKPILEIIQVHPDGSRHFLAGTRELEWPATLEADLEATEWILGQSLNLPVKFPVAGHYWFEIRCNGVAWKTLSYRVDPPEAA